MNKHVVRELTKEGCIVEKEAAESLTDEDIEAIKNLDSTPMYISERMLESLRQSVEPNGHDEDSQEPLEKPVRGQQFQETESREEEETVEEDSERQVEDLDLMDRRDRKQLETKVEIMDEKEISREEKDVPEFLQYYNDRYDRMKKLLMRRPELKSATTLNRLERRDEGEESTAIGLVRDKYSTNSGKYIVELEDKTTTFKALVDEREGDRIVQDEVIGVMGSMGGDIIYADSVVRADLPIPQGVKTTEQKVEAAYISDLHMGSKDTMHGQMEKFAKWLHSEEAKDIGYLVIAGDVVEGVGTYPGQEEDLEVTDIYRQYQLFEEWVEKIPEHVQIIVGPGNHDITRLAEPQPRLPEKALSDIVGFNNVHLVQNPQMVRLHGIESQGIKNLMYHGFSFDEHAAQIQELREKAYEEPHHLMIDLLKRRHLAPTYGSNLMSPEQKDHMIIEEEPDIFVAGHFHAHSNESYKGVNIINSSSFQRQTDFQKRVGHQPDPGKVTIVDYKTRNTRVEVFRD